MSPSAIRSFAPDWPKLALAVLLCCLIGAGSPGGARAVTEPTDLGAPSFAAYCKALGFLDARFTSGASKAWGCLHSDGAVTALDVQAACQFSYTERPILARELLPGAIYTWHCLQTAGVGGGTPGSGSPAPTSAQIRAALLAALVPHGRAARIGALLRRAYGDRFQALAGGRVRISWYLVPKGARLAKAHRVPVLIATGARSLTRRGATTIRIGLTSKGRRLLARSRRLGLTARGAFIPLGRPGVSATKTFTLKR
jgi:hypothetical protein